MATAVLSAACVGPTSTTSSTPVRTVSYSGAGAKAQEVFQLVNAARAAHGKAPVQWNTKLGGLAADWSAHMAAADSYGHRDLSAVLSSGLYNEFRSLAENILVGPCSMTAAQIHDAWMGSPSHRANIIGGYDQIGIGLECRSDGRLYSTENFGLV